MALKLSVKIGEVSNLSDARYAAGMGVDYIGFNINSKSTHFVNPESFKEIVNWISGVGIIGEIGNEPIEQNENYPNVLIETTNLSLSKELNEFIFRIKTIDLNQIETIIKPIDKALFFILDLTPSQIDKNQQLLTDLCTKYPIYLSSDFKEELLEKVVDSIKPTGIEIKGSLEDQPGFKDYDGIADVLEWLEVD